MICLTNQLIWKNVCSKIINLFNWFPWNNYILILKNLTNKNCNRLLTATYVLCQAANKSTDYLVFLFLLCLVADRI